ncbi:hypothetical protein GC088_14315 [Arthrobacter sp. JZ12]|uniref:hypothetical protein n=1 Tax=Arthrobacter sp. JZ12 TaxID=2654190 RepID=UPI002B47E54F|nr:hypothetical protein [Arthrobacter sp. JZ12]WRH26125.1 hypothetical protein GC088_14315 [Arthrobacter sp. JZ12]
MTPRNLRKRRERPLPDGSQLKWPGAEGKFALFAEVLWLGVLTAVGGLLLITLPAAIVASTRHLHRYLLAERSTIGQWRSDFVAALRTGWIVGLATTVLAVVLIFNLLLSGMQILPGWQVVFGVGILALTALAILLLQSAVRWTPHKGWREAVREGLASFTSDPGAIVPLLIALALTVVVTWQLPPLLVPGLGCLMFAVLVVKERERR